MNNMNNSAKVQEQYKTSGNLATRISIHDKYSVNKMGFGNWIFSHYGDLSGLRVLELGCGNGAMWKNRQDVISGTEEFILSDFSEGMLAAAKDNLGSGKIKYQVIDIQDIPFEDESFDVVISNMMLYHVPDIHKGLREVRRVLKKGSGKFFAATYGEHGIMDFMSELLSDTSFRDNTNKSFTLQNGGEILSSHFQSVTIYNYEDALEVTVTEDLAEYMLSLTSMADIKLGRDELTALLDTRKNNGVIRVPKEYGLFVCEK